MTNIDQNLSDLPETTPPADDAATEAFARRLGWRPEAEWANAPANRRPKSFITPSQYIEKVNAEVPILRDRLRQQDNQIVTLSNTVQENTRKLEETATVITQMHESQKTIRERAYKQAREDLTREMDAAARTGDGETYVEKKAQIDRLDAVHKEPEAAPPARPNGEAPPAKPAAPPQIPEVEAWRTKPENEWFNRSVPLNQAAIEYEAALPRTTPLAERLEQTGEWVREKFSGVYPQFFPTAAAPTPPGDEPPAPPALPAPPPSAPARNPRRTAAPSVQPPAGGGHRETPGLTYDKLNQDEKTHCDYLCRTVPGFTQEDFLADYKR